MSTNTKSKFKFHTVASYGSGIDKSRPTVIVEEQKAGRMFVRFHGDGMITVGSLSYHDLRDSGLEGMDCRTNETIQVNRVEHSGSVRLDLPGNEGETQRADESGYILRKWDRLYFSKADTVKVYDLSSSARDKAIELFEAAAAFALSDCEGIEARAQDSATDDKRERIRADMAKHETALSALRIELAAL